MEGGSGVGTREGRGEKDPTWSKTIEAGSGVGRVEIRVGDPEIADSSSGPHFITSLVF